MSQAHSNQVPSRWLRSVLLALVVTATAMIGASTASAAVTEAPEITQAPSNPNTTQPTVEFKYTVGEGETSTATPLRFYCRQYPTASPPSASAGWGPCGLSTDPSPSRTFTPPANGSFTFEVAVRETTAIETQGPIASAVWQHNLPAPSLPPVFLVTPPNPYDGITSTFKYKEGAGEEDLVDRFQCRFDSDEEADWTQAGCSTPGVTEITRQLGNGEHRIDIRAGNVGGWGPAASYEWTQETPEIPNAVRAGEVAIGVWRGQSANTSIGAKYTSPANVGDMNDDGENDLTFASVTDGVGFADVIWGPPSGGDRDAGSQKASEGFRVILPPDSFGFGPQTPETFPAGDQNGDGVDDLLITINDFLDSYVAVVYGGFDPRDLPQCADSAARCLELASMTPDQGFRITGGTYGLTSNKSAAAGDFDGDGADDLILGSFNGQGAYVMKGKPRSGDVVLSDLPDAELLQITGDQGAGSFVKIFDDLDGDGRDEALLLSDSGRQTIIYGRSLGGGPLDLTQADADDKIEIYGPAVAYLNIDVIGDVNGDGRKDLSATVGGSIVAAEAGVSVFYTPERGEEVLLAAGAEMEPGTGYFIRGGYDASMLGNYDAAESIGDLNNDGLPDMIVGDDSAYIDAETTYGALYALFNPRTPGDELMAGPELTPDLGAAMIGDERGDGFGTTFAYMGDWDDDGLGDFAVGAPGTDVNGDFSGSVYMIPGKSLISQAKTGSADGISNDAAALNAGVSTNNRDTQVHFEYGTSEEYSSKTAPESVEGSGSGDSVSATISGLTKNTTYHYRAVATNSLGLTRYGDDRTFTTTNTSGGSNCDTDNTLPGCSGYVHCKVKPAECQNAGKAKLALISSPKTIKVKRGKKGSVAAIVVNSGGESAAGVKVCIKAPKKFVKVKKCQTVGGLGSGATKTKTFKVTVKKSAKKGKKLALKITASSGNAGSKTAKAAIKVK